MKNKLMDLNNHLFEQLERLNDDDLKGEDLNREIKRSQAMSSCAAQIIDNAALALKAYTAINDGLMKSAPEMLGVKKAEALEERPRD
ncbi:hypothetical protein [Desulfobacter vibrioformis]|uniref:hypothetical protein n=1 Tax=Desulfobacter vibrioformis TaxID=34031 RepID=UPI00055256A0|nr:hypothetical protein [Desulfobacter vibrioformis]